MHPFKPIVTAGIVATLGLAPAYAQVPASAPTSPGAQSQSAPPPAPSPSSTTSSTTTTTQASNDNKELARQALAAARQSLAEMTKLPAVTSLQGEQRTQLANFISDFNSFATATTDWRSKYEVVDQSLDKLLGQGDSGSASGAAASSAATPQGGGAANLDPSITQKLQEVRTHLNEFEQASGDPLFAVDAIQKTLDTAAGGTNASASVTLTPAQVDQIRRQLETIRQAAKK
jgi:hypothetical protein